MEAYVPAGGLVALLITGLIAVKVGLEKRPTFKEADDRYKNAKVCDEIHKAAEARHQEDKKKLDCIPEIKTDVAKITIKLDLLLQKNGIKIDEQ